MSFDFNAFKKVDVANKRKEGGLPSKTQEYDNLKYRKALVKKATDGSTTSKFTVSKKQFEALGLNSNALDHFTIPGDTNTVLLGVVSNEDGKLLRQRKNRDKGDSFKSDALEAALSAAGIIDTKLLGKGQFIDLEVVGTNVQIDGVNVITALKLSKGTSRPKAEKPAVTETPSDGTTAEPKVEAEKASTPATPSDKASAEAEWN